MLTQLPPPPAPAPAQPQRRTHNRSIPVAGFKVQPVKAPFERDNPEQPLNCRNETSPQGRVKVVCQ
ncbi:MAG TPA: hypothetical protein VNS34_17105 [Rhizobiaceae bacterium]|nr:hypothetical protein [Rhizobiaceae bacterium]